MLDVSQIAGGLYQGSYPPTGLAVKQAGFNVLILCAKEYQPAREAFSGVHIVRCPLQDVNKRSLQRREWRDIFRSAKIVTRAVRRSKNVLVTCMCGLNRSSMVTGVALVMLTGCSGKVAVRMIKMARPGALFNAAFVQQLSWLQAC